MLAYTKNIQPRLVGKLYTLQQLGKCGGSIGTHRCSGKTIYTYFHMFYIAIVNAKLRTIAVAAFLMVLIGK
jgi:hypothetical protein